MSSPSGRVLIVQKFIYSECCVKYFNLGPYIRILTPGFWPKSQELCPENARKTAKTEFCDGVPRGQASSANHKQSGLGLHQRGWSKGVCVTLQRRPHHELAWIWTVFLSEQRRATDFVETVARRAANDSLHDVCTRLKTVRNCFYGKEVSAPLHRRACTGACAFWRRAWHAFKQVFFSTMHVQVCMLNRCFDISIHICVHIRCRVCTSAYVCAVCSFSVGGRGWGDSTSLWGQLLLGVGDYGWQKERWGCCLCVFCFYCRWECMCVCVCVYACTHTLQGTQMWAKGSGWDS